MNAVIAIHHSAFFFTEAIRPDEEPVLKTGGGAMPLVSSSLTASASTFVSRISSFPPRSRGPTATTLGPHPGNDGSTPSGTTGRNDEVGMMNDECQTFNSSFITHHSSFCSVLVEQPGVLACLSRRRSRVQIPPGTLGGLSQFSSQRKWDCPLRCSPENMTARYANRQSGEAQTFVYAGSTPACATRERASAGHR